MVDTDDTQHTTDDEQLQGYVLRLVLSNRLMNLGISKQQHLYLRKKKLI